MRVTNSMIINNTSNNMNSNKTSVDRLNNQMSTQKKIERPSDDPVIAIRSLRLRSSLSEIDQYYEKNIPDAESWLEVTETALKNMEDIIRDAYTQCVNGANDTLNEDDRKVILTSLQKLKEQVYAEGNADYAGRTVFTGYKTNKSLTFDEDTSETKYNITQRLNYDDLSVKTYYSGLSKVPTSAQIETDTLPTTDVEDHTYTRARLAYDNLGEITQLQYQDTDGTLKNINGMPITFVDDDGLTKTANVTYNVRSYDEWQDMYNFEVGKNEVVYIKETGELIMGKNVASHMSVAKPEIVVSYDKVGFSAGDLRPEHYFDCTDMSSPDPSLYIEYTKEDQPINYTIAFNQTITVNSQASDVFDSSIGRDVDELTDAVQMAMLAHEKVDKINELMRQEAYATEDKQALLNEWLETAQKEADYADNNMKNVFSAGITQFQGYLDDVTLARTDVGSKGARIDLTKSRMSNQQLTFEELKSTNEDAELSDVIIEYSAAYNAYQGSMQAASKAIKQTLLDFI